MNLGRMALELARKADVVGLKIHTNKIKVLCLTDYPTLRIWIDELNIEGIGQFVYLGSVVPSNDSTKLDVT